LMVPIGVVSLSLLSSGRYLAEQPSSRGSCHTVTLKETLKIGRVRYQNPVSE
jgi:hypothetical protein